MQPPAALIKKGITSLPCIGDGRQSGTSGSPSILNASPEAAAGGPLSIVQTGDWIVVDVAEGKLDLDIPESEFKSRTPNQATIAGYAKPTRGWERLYIDHVQQAEKGADLDFLIGKSSSQVTRESH